MQLKRYVFTDQGDCADPNTIKPANLRAYSRIRFKSASEM